MNCSILNNKKDRIYFLGGLAKLDVQKKSKKF